MTIFFIAITPNLSVTKALPIDLNYCALVSQPTFDFRRTATVIKVIKLHNQELNICTADFSSRAVSGVGLRPLSWWECGFESRRDHKCLPPVNVVCCHVEVSERGRLLVQRSPTDCRVSECDFGISIMRRPRLTGVVEPWKKSILPIYIHLLLLLLLY